LCALAVGDGTVFIFYQFTKQSFDNQQCISSPLAALSPQNKELVIMFLFGMVKKKKRKRKAHSIMPSQ